MNDAEMGYSAALLTLVGDRLKDDTPAGERSRGLDHDRAVVAVVEHELAERRQRAAQARSEAREDPELGWDVAMEAFVPVERQVLAGLEWLIAGAIGDPPEPFRESGVGA